VSCPLLKSLSRDVVDSAIASRAKAVNSASAAPSTDTAATRTFSARLRRVKRRSVYVPAGQTLPSRRLQAPMLRSQRALPSPSLLTLPTSGPRTPRVLMIPQLPKASP
jgi:hypothetical protein